MGLKESSLDYNSANYWNLAKFPMMADVKEFKLGY